MMTIHLQQLKFFAHHGVYKEEQMLGNDFVVDVILHFMPSAFPVKELQQTLNYEQVFAIVQHHMNIPTPLLETVVGKIVAQIQQLFPQVKAGMVSIAKMKPPVKGWEGNVVVSFNW